MGSPAYDYDYDRFGARQLDPEWSENHLRVVERREEKKQLRNQANQGALRSFRIVFIAAVLFAMFAAVMFCRVRLNEINAQYNVVKNQITIAESDNVRLTMELDAKASVYNIDEYAVEVLNMYKIGEQQIQYLEPVFSDELLLQRTD